MQSWSHTSLAHFQTPDLPPWTCVSGRQPRVWGLSWRRRRTRRQISMEMAVGSGICRGFGGGQRSLLLRHEFLLGLPCQLVLVNGQGTIGSRRFWVRNFGGIEFVRALNISIYKILVVLWCIGWFECLSLWLKQDQATYVLNLWQFAEYLNKVYIYLLCL